MTPMTSRRHCRPAIVHLVPAIDPTKSDLVRSTLVGARPHIGEKEYYEALNKRFEGYDVVLYELVAPAGTLAFRRRPKPAAIRLPCCKTG